MADRKVSELDELVANNMQFDNEFLVNDTSTTSGESKKTTLESIINRGNSGIVNARFKFDGVNTVSIEPIVGDKFGCYVPDYNDGSMTFLTSGALSIELATSTVTGSVAKLNSTYFVNAPAVPMFGYIIDDNGELVFAISRNPNLKTLAPYFYNNSSTTRSSVGDTTNYWGTLWVSKSSTITPNARCISIGYIMDLGFDLTNGRLAGASNAVSYPIWGARSSLRKGSTDEPHFYDPVWGGYSSDPVLSAPGASYDIIGNLCHVTFKNLSVGTSNSTRNRVSLPIPASEDTYSAPRNIPIIAYDNGSIILGRAILNFDDSGGSGVDDEQIVHLAPNQVSFTTTDWTNTGGKGAWLDFTYPID